MDRQIRLNKNEKKQKIRKMKLKSQRKLSAVNKTAPTKSTAKEPDREKVSIAPSKIKTAKDHEHYRKSKRPTRIWFDRFCCFVNFFEHAKNFSVNFKNKIENIFQDKVLWFFKTSLIAPFISNGHGVNTEYVLTELINQLSHTRLDDY